MGKARPKRRGLAPVHHNAAGLDVGSTFHVVAVRPDLDPDPVKTFSTFTPDLQALADWLEATGVTTVAMESTGVYWIPVYELLEQRGFDVLLVNARLVKSVPGRKTDVNDAQWLQQLHEYGLLRGSFRPRDDIAALRGFLRHRDRMVKYAASHVQHMQKALMQLNVQLHHVVSDITGATGMRILRAITQDEERDPATLAAMRDRRCKNSEEVIRDALCGNYRPEHVFALKQALMLYDSYQAAIRECDFEIEGVLEFLNQDIEPPADSIPPPRSKGRSGNAPRFDVRSALYNLVGADLTQIHGVGPYMALMLIAECGDDMTRFPSSKHFTSWLTLAPGNKITGGKVISSKTRRSSNRAASLFRTAAVAAGRTDTAIGAFYRRLAARIGKIKAITATARKLAVLFYNTLRHGSRYADPGADWYEQHYRERVLQNLQRRARSLGLRLVEAESSPGVS